MFSNRSVSVQASAPPTENGVVPDALTVDARLRNWFQVVAGFTPALLKAWTLYQTSDLLLALKTTP